VRITKKDRNLTQEAEGGRKRTYSTTLNSSKGGAPVPKGDRRLKEGKKRKGDHSSLPARSPLEKKRKEEQTLRRGKKIPAGILWKTE